MEMKTGKTSVGVEYHKRKIGHLAKLFSETLAPATNVLSDVAGGEKVTFKEMIKRINESEDIRSSFKELFSKHTASEFKAAMHEFVDAFDETLWFAENAPSPIAGAVASMLASVREETDVTEVFGVAQAYIKDYMTKGERDKLLETLRIIPSSEVATAAKILFDGVVDVTYGSQKELPDSIDVAKLMKLTIFLSTLLSLTTAIIMVHFVAQVATNMSKQEDSVVDPQRAVEIATELLSEDVVLSIYPELVEAMSQRKGVIKHEPAGGAQ